MKITEASILMMLTFINFCSVKNLSLKLVYPNSKAAVFLVKSSIGKEMRKISRTKCTSNL